MEKVTIAVDVDDVCLSLVPAWLKKYNRDYRDNLNWLDITDWNISKFVSKDCGMTIYDYLNDPKLFINAEEVPGAYTGVCALRRLQCKVIFVTASDTADAKYHWLLNHHFLKNREDYIVCFDKSRILADYLLDDCYDNVQKFTGKGVLFTMPWNTDFIDVVRVDSWKQFTNLISVYLQS